MGLFGFGKKKKYLLEWQKVVMTDSPDRLITTEQQLRQISEQQASNDLRIIADCTKLLKETINADVFFSRLELLKETSKHLTLLEPYVNFTGASPSDALKEVFEHEQIAICYFIRRYYDYICDKVGKLKTEKAKQRQYGIFRDTLTAYFDKMNQDNIQYVQDTLSKLNIAETGENI